MTSPADTSAEPTMSSPLKEALPNSWDRLPDPGELVRYGGKPGVVYLYASGLNMGKFVREGWEQARDVGVQLIDGPAGSCDMILMCWGDPIQAASTNGVRRFFVDPDLLETTGFGAPNPPAKVLAKPPAKPKTDSGGS